MNNENNNSVNNLNQNPVNSSNSTKKSKAWIIIVIIIILVLLLLLWLFTRDKKVHSELSDIKDEMAKNINNFSYNVKLDTNLFDMNFIINMNCKEDLTNKLGYCNINSDLFELEQYYDYKNKIEYTRSTSILDSDVTPWTKIKSNNGSNNTLNLYDHIYNLKKEQDGDRVKYIGELNSKSLKNLITKANDASSNKIKINSLFSKKIPIIVYVDSSNYIDSMEITFDLFGINEHITIDYFDYNSSGSITLPELK